MAAVVVACVFASLPTLARVQDHVSTHDDAGSFRLSKNLERPHEKIGAAMLGTLPTFRIACDTLHSPDTVAITSTAFAAVVVSPLASRAPPAR